MKEFVQSSFSPGSAGLVGRRKFEYDSATLGRTVRANHTSGPGSPVEVSIFVDRQAQNFADFVKRSVSPTAARLCRRAKLKNGAIFVKGAV
jgi:hypothetical protein